jgi:carboxymethylenebutenolidase
VSETITLTATDGHELSAYVAKPEGEPKGGLVVLQEIFGVNDHIKKVTDGFAADGFLAIAPAMFDRVEKDLVPDYSDFETARATMGKLDMDNCVLDMAAAADHVRPAGKVATVGYCWGGALADLAACNGLVDVAVSYYGRMTVEWLDKKPQCPVLYHFGETDQLIPMQTIEQIRRGRDPKICKFRVWGGAGHGFNCDSRPEYHKRSATKALEETYEFIDQVFHGKPLMG